MQDMRKIDTENLIDYKLIVNQLKGIRKSMHITQQELAERSGLSRHTIINIESEGDYNPSINTLLSYAKAIGATIYVDQK